MFNIDSTFTLNNGVKMPALGFGVFQASPEETVTSVKEAIRTGYRLIDTASVYGNEHEVGEAIRQSGVDRNDLFVTTKVWISEYGYDDTLYGFERSMRKLGLEQLDLYLMHWPVPRDWERSVDTWKAMVRLYEEGRIKAIGVSNFEPEHIERLAQITSVLPAVNQVELHPYFNQSDLRAYHKTRGIITQAWSPLGGVNIYESAKNHFTRSVLEDAVLEGIASRHGKSTAQVILRWHLQHGTAVIPKSVKPARIAQNADLFDFQLSDEEMLAIDNLNTGLRGGHVPDEGDRNLFPAVVTD
ncbi:TPA: aldo/keto reductase [Klebsiella quasipneumoniae subsp. quasipneumoniae]|uniref:aldo/keto reductase n=1 Tax=Klebsiella quasipneumoniae TaxID=1463165 RepID=UPI000C7A9BEB|nr:aldo/keto reductase [Klebsiella quasipneumoniae]HBR1673830.1 aldo/keto reductase [Klebsiella quasipneumoniae subsp. quasipneumoniae]MBC5112923.1 aldo/keto reductase [Klebsiella quasipneumoniae]MCB3857220.1 aldo/keto reductase [Klebsiella quasipneumoniae]MCZ0712946.1 aldo/keto reductase [Klebsiella quasipneumoniae]MDI3216513.1 aldo/keto reductase [Klebsiella quasipneumoniae]